MLNVLYIYARATATGLSIPYLLPLLESAFKRICVVITLYPVCRWFASVEQRRTEGWVICDVTFSEQDCMESKGTESNTEAKLFMLSENSKDGTFSECAFMPMFAAITDMQGLNV